MRRVKVPLKEKFVTDIVSNRVGYSVTGASKLRVRNHIAYIPPNKFIEVNETHTECVHPANRNSSCNNESRAVRRFTRCFGARQRKRKIRKERKRRPHFSEVAKALMDVIASVPKRGQND